MIYLEFINNNDNPSSATIFQQGIIRGIRGDK